MRYAIDTEIVFGDPAFRMHVPGEYETEPAAQTFDGSTLTVTGPEEWTMVPYHPEMLAEWGYESELYMYTAPGAIPRVYWAGSYDNQDMYFGVQLHLDEAPVSIEELSEAPSPLGLGGGLHIDEHAEAALRRCGECVCWISMRTPVRSGLSRVSLCTRWTESSMQKSAPCNNSEY